jgi:hypothetical protein
MLNQKLITKLLWLSGFMIMSLFVLVNIINQRVTIQYQVKNIEAQIAQEESKQIDITNKLYDQSNQELKKLGKESKIERIDPQKVKSL